MVEALHFARYRQQRSSTGRSVKLDASRGIVSIFLLLIMFGSIASTKGVFQSSNIISSIGSVSYGPRDVGIDFSQVIGVNDLALGFNLDHVNWNMFVSRSTMQQLARGAGFILIRQFDFRKVAGYSVLMPCTHWDDNPALQTWDWTNVDQLTQKIFAVGAEPLYCLGSTWQNGYPPAMPMDSTTGLPKASSYAAYCKAWVTHFKNLGKPVRYYQILNEANHYFFPNWVFDSTKMGYYLTFFNTVANAMRSENSNVRLSFDSINYISVLDYWLGHGGGNLDYLDFHKYDEGTVGEYTDAQVFTRTEQWKIETLYGAYGVDDARQKWYDARGKWLPIMNSETNFCSGYDGGTEPRMQEMAGAVWLALLLRISMLKGLSYNLYYDWASAPSGSGYGFGMINSDDNQPRYPYYVNKMIGSNLAVGDNIVKADSSISDIRSIAWVHQGKLNILLIHKATGQKTFTIGGVNGPFSISWLDNASPTMQTGQISSNTLTMNGYSVALLQMP